MTTKHRVGDAAPPESTSWVAPAGSTAKGGKQGEARSGQQPPPGGENPGCRTWSHGTPADRDPASALAPLERLTGRIAHDFNNLLSIILSSVDLLEFEMEPTDHRRDSLRDIEAAARRGAELVEQLAAFGRQQLLQPMVVDLNEEMRRLAVEIQGAVGDQTLLKLQLGSDPASVRIDPAQLRRVVLCLAANARDAMPDGGTLTIDVETLELAGFDPSNPAQPMPCVMVAVSDTGVGMNEQTRAHAFEPFFTTKEHGTGMGLSSVRGIVGQSGGAVWLDSSPQEGTTLAIYFPRVTSASPAAIGSGEKGDAALTGDLSWILLVDDDAAVRRTVGRLLQAAGFVVIQAGSPQEALEAASQHGARFGLVLTDVMMPEMTGMELVERLECSIPKLKALYMSGHPAEALADLDQARRCQPFVQKPLRRAELVATVRALLEGRSLPASVPASERSPAVKVA